MLDFHGIDRPGDAQEDHAASALPPGRRAAEIAVVVPTFNEAANLHELVRRVTAALDGLAWELIVVDDDSPDGTAARVRALHAGDPRVRIVRRIGRRGLASACVEGILASAAPLVAVMDADGQHDPALLAPMARLVRTGAADLVVASRYMAGGSVGAWSAERARASRIATRLANWIGGQPLTDPMSGFFLMRRDVIDRRARELSAIGFKILLDIVLTCRAEPLRIVELPLCFAPRRHGESKLDGRVAWDYLLLLADKTLGGVVPVRFVSFAAIGAVGVGLHLLVLALLVGTLGFVAAQAAATGTAMLANYSINNVLTFADRRRRGWRWLAGLGSFAAVCAVGALASVGIAAWLFGRHVGSVPAALAGIAASAVWNYGVSARYTWSR